MKTIPVQSPCPMCHETGTLMLLTTNINIPYFGDGLETTMRCDACGFRHADFMILGQKDPLRVTFRGETLEDQSVRVIRSNSGTVRLPEIGFVAEPTPLSESYVSNVEGVFARAKDILLMALDWHGEDVEKRNLLLEYLSRLDDFQMGKAPFTLIIDDPLGNSAIVSDRVLKRALTPEELDVLPTGMIILEKDDLVERLKE